MVPITCSSKSPGNRLLLWMYFNKCNGIRSCLHLIDSFYPLCTAWLQRSSLSYHFNKRLRPDVVIKCISLHCNAIIMANVHFAVWLLGKCNISSLHMYSSTKLKQSLGDSNRCSMVVLSWVHQGFSAWRWYQVWTTLRLTSTLWLTAVTG